MYSYGTGLGGLAVIIHVLPCPCQGLVQSSYHTSIIHSISNSIRKSYHLLI